MLRSALVRLLAPPPHPRRVATIGALLGLLLVLCLPTGCREAAGAAAPRDRVVAAVPPAAGSPVADVAADRGSLHDLGLRFRDATGAERELASVGGPVRVVAMVYTSCAHTCPLVVAEMKRLEAALPAAEHARVGFVLVSLDPARDGPAQLAAFAAHAALDPARWTLLTGGEDDVLTLAAALGVRYRAGADGEIAHSNLLTVLDARGRIAHQQQGLGDGAATRAAVERLLD
ncbi:MAG TPA: SCO family protein [Gemmatimonadaceae bacterium]|nr:SCO family protein [Gemmatimonadaceae bacterium]